MYKKEFGEDISDQRALELQKEEERTIDKYANALIAAARAIVEKENAKQIPQ